MYPWSAGFVAAALLPLASTALNTNNISPLKPVTPAELGLQKRTTSNVQLANSASMYWGNVSDLLVNVTLQSGESEMVISMDHFSSDLTSVTCENNNTLDLTFTSQGTYNDAIDDWEWVNFAANRSFIMIVNYGNCGADDERQPWKVTGVNYDSDDFNVKFNATQMTWPTLNNSLSIEWGQYTTTSSNSKRDYDLGTHNLDVSHSFDKTLFSRTTQNGLSFEIDCSDCGTTGTIAVSGKIESFLGIPTGVDITATPNNVGADLELTFDVSGSLGNGWNKNLNLLTVGLPGFSIPDIVTVGPELEIDVGFELSAISGDASITTGVTAKVPNTATATLSILGDSSTSFSGWTPTISQNNLTATAEVDGSLEMYTMVSVDIGVEVLGFGVGAGIALKVPDLSVNFAASYDKDGVCSGSDKPYGVTFGGGIGGDLQVNAYTEAFKIQTIQWSKDLWNNPSLISFPDTCIAFGSAPKSSIDLSGKATGSLPAHTGIPVTATPTGAAAPTGGTPSSVSPPTAPSTVSQPASVSKPSSPATVSSPTKPSSVAAVSSPSKPASVASPSAVTQPSSPTQPDSPTQPSQPSRMRLRRRERYM